MSEKVGTCQYEGCKREPLPDSKDQYCICHEKRNEKDIEAFNREIEKIMKLGSYDFIGFYFPEKFDFEVIYEHLKNRTFDKKVDFSHAIFNCEANFEKIKFKNSTVSSGVKFKEEANFRNAEFKKASNFKDTIFKEWADFMHTIFEKKANFGYTQFKKGGDFRHARFEEQAYFLGAKFQEADFSYATLKKTDFAFTRFQEEANFGHARFQIAEFYDAVFEKKADFWKCSVTKRISFSNATFYDTFLLINVGGKPRFDFMYTRFSNRTRIGGNTYLGRALFRYSTVEEVDFLGIDPLEKLYEEKLLEKKCDQEKLKDEEEEYCPENWEEVSTIYRKLKQAHQKHGQYDIAGEFYYREMECKRKSYRKEKERGWFLNYFWFWLLRILCGYGERIKNIVGCSAFIVFSCSFFYYLFGISPVKGEIIKFSFESGFSLREFGYSIYYSIVTFTSLGYGDIHPLGQSHAVASVEVILGVFLMALFVVVFVRKMSR